MRDGGGELLNPYTWAETATNEEIGGLIEAPETDLAHEKMKREEALVALREARPCIDRWRAAYPRGLMERIDALLGKAGGA